MVQRKTKVKQGETPKEERKNFSSNSKTNKRIKWKDR